MDQLGGHNFVFLNVSIKKKPIPFSVVVVSGTIRENAPRLSNLCAVMFNGIELDPCSFNPDQSLYILQPLVISRILASGLT